MEFKITSTNRHRRNGFTLLELLIASSIGLMFMAVVLSLVFYTTRSIAAMTDSVVLSSRGRHAIDRMSKKLRQARVMNSFSATSVTVTYNGLPLTYAYQAGPKTLLEIENGSTNTLLQNCDELAFAFYKRNPVGNSFNQFPILTATNEAKVIQVKWKCRTDRIGKADGEAQMDSARIVLRVK